MKNIPLLIAILAISFSSCKKEKKPEACFEVTNNNGYYWHFTNCSTDADHYLWDLGDGRTSSEFIPNEYVSIYYPPGTYTIKLTAYSPSGNRSDETTQTITVH
jgi:PKD repeat protein